MRIIVVSDSHGRCGNLFDIIEMHIEDADLFVCLGDCNDGRDFENAQIYFKDKLKLRRVAGNNDWYSNAPNLDTINANGKKVLFCHGHTLKVKFTTELLLEKAKEIGADVVLFGHTHTPYKNYVDGIHIFNPGAVCNGKYGILDITDSGIMAINASL